MDTKNEPLVMYVHDGTKLEVNSEFILTIDDEVPESDDVVDFLIDFAKDSVKDPIKPDKGLMDVVKDVAIEEELKRKQEKDHE